LALPDDVGIGLLVNRKIIALLPQVIAISFCFLKLQLMAGNLIIAASLKTDPAFP